MAALSEAACNRRRNTNEQNGAEISKKSIRWFMALAYCCASMAWAAALMGWESVNGSVVSWLGVLQRF